MTSIFMAGTYASEPPLSVQIRADGRTNSRLDNNCFSGIQFANSGTEYEYNPSGSLTNGVAWLLSGNAADVWVVWSRTGGTLSDWDSLGSGTNNVRLNLATGRSWRIVDTISSTVGGAETIIGDHKLWDAASGGNLLADGPSATWSARRWHDACPICCFTPDTPILMASGLEIPISQVREGDLIAVYDLETDTLGSERCIGITTMTNRPMYRLGFDDGRIIEASEDHPFEVKGKGPSSIKPDASIQYKNLATPATLELYDYVLGCDGRPHGIMSIDRIKFPGKVYTLDNHCFIARGLVVY